jgi:hypothetical protein
MSISGRARDNTKIEALANAYAVSKRGKSMKAMYLGLVAAIAIGAGSGLARAEGETLSGF